MIERYIETAGFDSWTHLHPTFFMENLISYGGVETMKGNKLVVPYRADVKVPWVCCDDIGACAATVLANPTAHAGKAYPLEADAASHAEIAELMSKVLGEQFRVEQVDMKDWFKCLLEHGAIEVSNTRVHCCVLSSTTYSNRHSSNTVSVILYCLFIRQPTCKVVLNFTEHLNLCGCAGIFLTLCLLCRALLLSLQATANW